MCADLDPRVCTITTVINGLAPSHLNYVPYVPMLQVLNCLLPAPVPMFFMPVATIVPAYYC